MNVGTFSFHKKAALGKEPLTSMFGQIEKVPLLKLECRYGKGTGNSGRSNPNLPCNLMIGTDFSFIEGLRKKDSRRRLRKRV